MIGWALVVAAAVPARGGTVVTPGVPVGTSVTVRGGSPEQLDLVRWAVRRFEVASLRPPTLEVRFHATRSGCDGHFGYYRAGGVDLCGTMVNLMTRRNLLHEMAHAWVEANLGPEERERFLQVRGLSSWNGGAVPWRERGFEQTAEILAWYLGDRVLSATVPHNGPEQLETAIAVLLSAAEGVPGARRWSSGASTGSDAAGVGHPSWLVDREGDAAGEERGATGTDTRVEGRWS